MPKTTEELLQELIVLQKANAGKNVSAPAATTAASSPGATAFEAATGVASKAMEGVTGVLGKAKEGFDFLQAAVQPSLDTFKTLSKTGASFSNDIVGMTVASKNMRLELDEFADIMKNNAANFTGLGGNVTRGAEQFAKLSKGLMESPFIDTLRQAGYTNKELNDVLALQIGFMRTSMADGKERDQEAIDSAQKLATEMDLMAKLTGKSREEQMENMKKAQADMQVEAKFRLIGAKEGPEAEAKARKLYAEQYNEAQLRGQGQVFKETFALGQVVSKEAATQVALTGKEARETQRAALATQKGEEEEARAASKAAQLEAIRNGQDVSKLQLALTGDMTTAGKVFTEQMANNRGLFDSFTALKKENEEQARQGKARKLSDEELMTEAKKRAADAAAGRDAEGKQVNGATAAMINLGSRAKDVTAALTDSLLTPLNKQIGPGLYDFTQTYLSSRVAGTGKSVSQSIRDSAAEGREQAGKEEKGAKRGVGDVGTKEEDRYFGESTVKEAARNVQKIVNVAEEGINKAVQAGNVPKRRQTGSIGETGNLIEDFGAGTLAMLHGKEAVLTEDQLKNLAKGANIEGMKNQAQAFQQSASLNVDKIKKDLVTFSSTSTKKEVLADFQKMSGMMPSVDTKIRATTQETAKSLDEQKKAVISAGLPKTPVTEPLKQIDRKSLKFDQYGMPITQDIKYKADEIVQTAQKKEAEAKATTPNVEDMKKGIAAGGVTPKPEEKKPDTTKTAVTTGKESTLNDVVVALNQLNTKMNSLIDVQKDIGNKQIKATKANSNDVYARV